MAIPEFDENGNLPRGIHSATMTEIKKRFVYNQRRKRMFAGLMLLARNLKSAGCKTLFLDGSFISDKAEPADYDAVWEFEGVDSTIDPLLRDGWDMKAIKGRYGGDVFCRMPEVLDKDHVEFFQTDRTGKRKGIIRIDLRMQL